MTFEIDDIQAFKQQALQWAASAEVCCYLDSNNYADKYSRFDVLIAAGAKEAVTGTSGNGFAALEDFRKKHGSWVAGFFGYDLKNAVENLSSSNHDGLNFPDYYFFVPEHLIIIKGNQVTIFSKNSLKLKMLIEKQALIQDRDKPALNLKSRFTKAKYLNTINQIKEHINRGDIYVTNFCQEFYSENAAIDPLTTFRQLIEISPTPFSAFLKLRDKYVICASPERFLAKRNNTLISQPIKGTAKRAGGAEDEHIKKQLRNHPKEQQENVMIVDLVRNDLTRSAKQGTVKTEELFGIYSFRQVHQMISTVTCEIDKDVSPVQAVKNTFPMGSMTGAPKVSAMKLMEHFERSKRGVYSGAIGYFDDQDNFDFNVVIRSILYNSSNQYLSFQVGSAITYDADAEKEYDECLLKAQAILEVLGQTISSQQS